MARIFVTRPVPSRGLELLVAAFGEENVAVSPHERAIRREELIDGVRGAEGLLAILTDTVDADVMDAAGPQLKIVANYAVGYDNVDVAAATERGIAVTNTPGVLTETTADLAWALLMSAARRIVEADCFVRDGRWTGWGPRLLLGVDVHGKTLGLFGMGRIGRAVARRAAGFDMRVLYHDRGPIEEAVEKRLDATFVDQPTLLAESDFLSIHVPLLPETRHAFGAAEFKAMKRTACLVNTSRGPVVDEAALAEALEAREVFAAGLDVFEDEPRVHPRLLACENAVIVPHVGSASIETRATMAQMAAQNIIARLRGEVPPNCVNPQAL